MKANQWLTNITGIQEGTPYHGQLTSGEELPGDAIPEDMATHSMNGIALFKMKDGWLHFDFTGDEDTHYLAQSVIAKSAAPVISIPSEGSPATLIGGPCRATAGVWEELFLGGTSGTKTSTSMECTLS